MVVKLKTEEQLLKEGWLFVNNTLYRSDRVTINSEMREHLGFIINVFELEKNFLIIDGYHFPFYILEEEYEHSLQVYKMKKEIGL